MDVTILIISLVFGLVLTLIGLRNTVIAVLSILFNVAVFTDLLVNGITEQLNLASLVQEITYDAYPVMVLPAFFVIMSVIKIAKYR